MFLKEISYVFLTSIGTGKKRKEYVHSSLGDLCVFYSNSGIHIFRGLSGIQMYHIIWF